MLKRVQLCLNRGRFGSSGIFILLRAAGQSLRHIAALRDKKNTNNSKKKKKSKTKKKNNKKNNENNTKKKKK